MNEFERTVEAVKHQNLRRVTRIVTEPHRGIVRLTLGCGHTVQIQTGLPDFTVTDIYGVDLGDEVDCPHCQPATKH